MKAQPLRKSSALLKGFWLSSIGLALALATQGCASGPCRQLKHPELAQKVSASNTTSDGAGANAAGSSTATAPAAGATAAGGSGVNNAGTKKSTTAAEGRVLVYKADGSLQCGMGKAITPQEMEKQLNGIKVYSRENRPDGKMHIQVCGSPTGMINVYEIPQTSLREAEKRGFKKFTPEE
jgi:hypothetical protein